MPCGPVSISFGMESGRVQLSPACQSRPLLIIIRVYLACYCALNSTLPAALLFFLIQCAQGSIGFVAAFILTYHFTVPHHERLLLTATLVRLAIWPTTRKSLFSPIGFPQSREHLSVYRSMLSIMSCCSAWQVCFFHVLSCQSCASRSVCLYLRGKPIFQAFFKLAAFDY